MSSDDYDFLLLMKPILEKMENTTKGLTLAQPEVETVITFLTGMTKMLDDMGTYAASLENHIEELQRESKRVWTP